MEAVLPEQAFGRAEAIGGPAHRSRFATTGDSDVWQICFRNLREGWLKRAA